MLDIKQAVAKGKTYVSELFVGEGATDFLLEEVDISSDKKLWLITVSFLRNEKVPAKPKLKGTIDFSDILEFNAGERRLFKTAVVDSDNGDLIKIVRDVADLAA
jgi:hypothetical protein